MLRNLLFIVLGLLIAPFAWFLRKTKLLKPLPVVPKPIQDFSNYLAAHGLFAGVYMQDVKVNHVDCIAYLQFGLNPANFHVVTLTSSSTPEEAAEAEREALTAPQFTGVRRNGTLVMACTFNPPNSDLEARIISAFTRYQHP